MLKRLFKAPPPKPAPARPVIEPAHRFKTLYNILQPDRLTRIVDIGANPINPAPYDAALQEGLIQVYGFEPQAVAFEKLSQTPQKNRTVFPYAVGDGTQRSLQICKGSGFTSLLEPNPAFPAYTGHWAPRMEVTERLLVDTKRLDDIPDLGEVDLVKIDIQGGETLVFEHGQKTLANAIAVMTEIAAIPLYKNQPLLDDQMRVLRSAGFDLHTFAFFKRMMLAGRYTGSLLPRRHANQLIDGDAIFVRGLLALRDMPSERLKHLAILADTVFASFDLVLKVLEELETRSIVSGAAIVKYVEQLPDQKPPE